MQTAPGKLMLVATAFVLLSSAAPAAVIMTITGPSSFVVFPGEDITITGTLENTGAEAALINGLGWNSSPFNPFLSFPTSGPIIPLDPGQSYTGELATFAVDPSLGSGLFTIEFLRIFDSPPNSGEGNAFESTTGVFTVQVVPEPQTGLLVLSALSAVVIVRCNKKEPVGAVDSTVEP